MYNNTKLVNNHFDQTPLHFMVKFNDFNIVDNLLQRGNEVNVIDIFGNTPLSLACIEKPSVDMVRLLLRYNADINLERPDHLDLFLESVLNCRTKTQISIIKILIKQGININGTDWVTNRNCMHYVAMTGYLPLAKVLLEAGAFLNIRDNFDFTPTQIAQVHEHEEVLKLFCTYKPQ